MFATNFHLFNIQCPPNKNPSDSLRLPFAALNPGSKIADKREEGIRRRGMGKLAEAKVYRLGKNPVCVLDNWIEMNLGARIPQLSKDSKQPLQIIPVQPTSPTLRTWLSPFL